jgi:hypothetical protein
MERKIQCVFPRSAACLLREYILPLRFLCSLLFNPRQSPLLKDQSPLLIQHPNRFPSLQSAKCVVKIPSSSWSFVPSSLRVYVPPRKINFHEYLQFFTDLRAFSAKNCVNPLPRNAIPRRAFPQSAKPLYRVGKQFFARPKMRVQSVHRSSPWLKCHVVPLRPHFPKTPVERRDQLHRTRASSSKIALPRAHLPRPGAHLRPTPAHLRSHPPRYPATPIRRHNPSPLRAPLFPPTPL